MKTLVIGLTDKTKLTELEGDLSDALVIAFHAFMSSPTQKTYSKLNNLMLLTRQYTGLRKVQARKSAPVQAELELLMVKLNPLVTKYTQARIDMLTKGIGKP